MIQKPATTDPVLDEIHRTRREMSEKFGGDFKAMLDDARKRQAESGRPVWTPKKANQPMQPSGEAGRIEVDDPLSPPADR